LLQKTNWSFGQDLFFPPKADPPLAETPSEFLPLPKNILIALGTLTFYFGKIRIFICYDLLSKFFER